jgi:hypothetical protein
VNLKSWNSLAGYTAVSARRRPVEGIAGNASLQARSWNELNEVRPIINFSYSYGDNGALELWRTSPNCGCVDGLNAAGAAWRSHLERGFPSCDGDRASGGNAEHTEKLKRFYTEETRRTHRQKEGFVSAFHAEGTAKANSKRPPKKKKQAAAPNSTEKITATRRSGFNLGKLGRSKQRPYAREINAGDSAGTAQAGLPVPRNLAQRMRPAICRISWRSGGKSDRTF